MFFNLLSANQTREVYCGYRSDSSRLPANHCEAILRPKNQRNCYDRNCNAIWRTGQWAKVGRHYLEKNSSYIYEDLVIFFGFSVLVRAVRPLQKAEPNPDQSLAFGAAEMMAQPGRPLPPRRPARPHRGHRMKGNATRGNCASEVAELLIFQSDMSTVDYLK